MGARRGFVWPRRDSEAQFTRNDRRTHRRNFDFGVAKGAMLVLGDTLFNPSLAFAPNVADLPFVPTTPLNPAGSDNTSASNVSI